MSILNELSGGQSAGGSQNTASSWSSTDAASARSWSEQQATLAYERNRQLMQEQMAYNSAEAEKTRNFNSAEAQIARDFNSLEAEKARNWELEAANTIYTRSAENMKAAGINPILAYNMGLTGAGVASGATASGMSASGPSANASIANAPLAQNFMDSQSASQAQGSSWNSSENGLATGLQLLGQALGNALGAVNSSLNLNLSLDGLNQTEQVAKNYINNMKENGNDYQKTIANNWDKLYGGNKLWETLSGLQIKALGLDKNTNTKVQRDKNYTK